MVDVWEVAFWGVVVLILYSLLYSLLSAHGSSRSWRSLAGCWGLSSPASAAASLVLLAGAIGTRIVPALGVLRRSSPAMCMIGAMPKSIPN
jgi:hypothetical protein